MPKQHKDLGTKNDPLDMILTIAKVNDSADCRIFSVGPFGKRVNFYHQQYRSHVLAKALIEKGIADASVLVVGAGISGLTIAQALNGQCKSLRIFEQEPEYLDDQMRSIDRYVHPTMNFWPHLKNQHPTTHLPNLNWCSGDAANIASTIFSKANTLGVTPETNHQAKSIRQTGKKVEVKYHKGSDQASGANGDENFDYVILCTGFGKEEIIEEIFKDSYWNPSSVTKSKMHRQLGNARSVGVSGLGDGALIDALYCLYAKPINASAGRNSTFQFSDKQGSIILELFGEIKNRTKVSNLVLEAERAINANDDALAIKKYDEAARELDKSTTKKLLEILYEYYDEATPEIRLYGYKKIKSCLGSAAPIHKLLITHACQKGHIRYQELKTKLTKTSAKKLMSKNEDNLDMLIIRHGPVSKTSPLDIIKNEDFNLLEFQKKQRSFEEFGFGTELTLCQETLKSDLMIFLSIHLSQVLKTNYEVRNFNLLLQKAEIEKLGISLPRRLGCKPLKLQGYKIFGHTIKFVEPANYELSKAVI